jgi:hypothetical protein
MHLLNRVAPGRNYVFNGMPEINITAGSSAVQVRYENVGK